MTRVLALALVAACSSSPPPRPLPVAAPAPVATQPRPRDPVPPAFRLPGDVRPTKIALDLTVVPDQEKAPGRVHIDAQVVRPTRVVWLNATDIAVSTATLGGEAARVVPGGDDFIGLTTDRELAAGPLAIDVAFTAGIDHAKPRGVYTVAEGGESYSYTFFESTDARRAFPCFDEPSYKIPWQLTLHAKAGHVALANAAVVRETPEPGGMKRVEIAESKPLPSYLVAFVVGPFEVIDDGTAGRAKTPIRFIVPKGRAGELGWAKDVTPRIVTALEDYFDMAYPYGKLDVAVVPRYWGTMEHPGIVAMGQPLTLIRPEQATRSRKQAYANILAHELSHYWFGDYVTMAWWDDTWLNEALGEWMDMIITSAVEPAWRFRDERVGISTSALGSDAALSVHAIRQPVTTREGIQAAFDGEITYFKGSSVLRMFEASVGPDKWRDFIRAYVRAHAWGNATADDLLGAIRAAFGAPVEVGMRSFLEQPGAPLVAVKADCAAKQLVVTQTRALPAGVTDPAPKRWTLPVCVRFGTAGKANEQCVMLAEAEARIPLEACPTWVLPNANANGYYRSSVDPVAARAMLDGKSPIGKRAALTAPERMMLVADLRAGVERQELEIDQLLRLVPLVAADPDPAVAEYAFEAASFRADALDDALYQQAQAFSLRAFGPLARRLGWARSPADSDELQALRRSVLGDVARLDPKLGKQAEEMAARWLDNRKGIDDDLVPTVLSTAAYRGGALWYPRYLAAARGARDRSEQQRMLGALGGFRDPKVVQQALDLLLAKEFDMRDTFGILYGALIHRETRDLGLAFLAAHIDELLGRLRDDEAAGFLGGVAGAYCDKPRADKMAALVVPRAAKYDGAQASVSRGVEASQQCIAAFARQLPALRRFLERQ